MCLWRLADEPKDATWLTSNERSALLAALAAEKHEKPKKDLLSALKDVRVLILTAITFCFTIGSYGVGIWLPLILKGHNLSNMEVGFISAIPYVFATIGMLAWAALSAAPDRRSSIWSLRSSWVRPDSSCQWFSPH